MAAAAAKHDESQKNYPDAAVIFEKITKTVIHKKSSLMLHKSDELYLIC